MDKKIYVEKKIICDICNKEFTKTMTVKNSITNNHTNTCQKCWDNTLKELEKNYKVE